jgi:hypothetical protein
VGHGAEFLFITWACKFALVVTEFYSSVLLGWVHVLYLILPILALSITNVRLADSRIRGGLDRRQCDGENALAAIRVSTAVYSISWHRMYRACTILGPRRILMGSQIA